MVEPFKITDTREEDVYGHFVDFQTIRGNFTVTLDWGYGDKLIIEVHEEESYNHKTNKFETKEIFDETISLD